MTHSNNAPSEEYQLIRKIQSVLGNCPSPHFPVTIGDDAALRISRDNQSLIITTDISVENIHFSTTYMTMQEIGYRAMVSNISDCAAMGAEPDSAFVQLVIPRKLNLPDESVMALYHGFAEASSHWQFPVAGGDLSRGNEWTIGITMLGRIPAGSRPLLRTGMQHGDRVYLSGIPGQSAAGLHLLQQVARTTISPEFHPLVQAHIRPEPQVDLGLFLSRSAHVHAAMDCSDGLAKDCRTLCFENDIGLIIDMNTSQPTDAMIKLSETTGTAWEEWYLQGGEDYTLLFTASPQFDPDRYPGRALFCIGECTKEYDIPIVRRGTELTPLETGGFDHLKTP